MTATVEQMRQVLDDKEADLNSIDAWPPVLWSDLALIALCRTLLDRHLPLDIGYDVPSCTVCFDKYHDNGPVWPCDHIAWVEAALREAGWLTGD